MPFFSSNRAIAWLNMNSTLFPSLSLPTDFQHYSEHVFEPVDLFSATTIRNEKSQPFGSLFSNCGSRLLEGGGRTLCKHEYRNCEIKK
jgi:hypothetical protein